MELKNSFKTLNYMRKILMSETDHILPFPVRPQKPLFAGQKPVPLPRCSPKQAAVPSKALNEFLKALSSASNGAPHTCIVARNDHVICEAAWAPYSTGTWHVTHSLCKSFVGTAIGMLWDEGKIELDEKICSIFPERCNLMTSRKARSLTVEHLLTMSSGSTFREAGAVVESDWVRGFLESEFEFEPGTQMDYNSMNTYLLSAILRRKAGCGLMEYLRPRLFEPMGFGDVAWERCPNGIEKGGWGMYVFLEDAVKLGMLYLHKGVWKGQRLLSEAWVEQATTTHLSRDTGEEYGFQIWTNSEKKRFLFNGMFGQYVIVCPDLDMVIGINAGAGNLFTRSATLKAANQLLAQVQSAAPDDPRAENELADMLAALSYDGTVARPAPSPASSLSRFFARLFRPAAPEASSLPPEIQSLPLSVFHFSQNHASLLPLISSCMNDWYSEGVKKCRFSLKENELSLLWWESGQAYELPIGFDHARSCTLNFGGNVFQAAARGKAVLNEDDELVLKITINYLELSSTRILKVFFRPDQTIRLQMLETPSLRLVFQMLEKNVPASVKSKMDLFRDMEYLWYRIDKVCSPVLTGTAQPQSLYKERETT